MDEVYVPLDYVQITKPGTRETVVHENLGHLNWKFSANGVQYVDNIIEGIPIFQNSDSAYVCNIPEAELSHVLARYVKLKKQKLTVSVLKEEYLFQDSHISAQFLQGLDQICDYNKVSCVVTNEREDILDIVVIGYMDNVRAAENRIRFLIDQSNPLMYLDFIQLDTVSILPLVAGVDFNNFKQVAKQTNCHLYLPSILPQGSKSSLIPDSRIYISGLHSQVVLTKALLLKIKQNITSPFVKSVPVDPSKKTILCLFNRQEAIVNMMLKNECFIQFPSAESEGSNVIFQANSLDAIERSIQDFICFMGEIYQITCQLQQDTLTQTDLRNIFSDLSSFSNCFMEISSDGDELKITGFNDEVKKAISLLTNYQLSTQALNRISCVRQSLELNNDERDFIGGKKNGKLLKIMSNTGSVIKIRPFSDFSFLVEVNSPTLQSSVMSLQMIEAELPKSTTFNIPESFHRQIIGVGGTTIQTIMRRFNVFIKFSNTFVFSGMDELDKMDYNPIQSFIRKSNVIIKCPAKNSNNIPYARQELEKLVQNCCNVSYMNTFVKLSRSHWRLLSNNSIGINNAVNNLNKNTSNSTFITDLEKQTNTFIKFPEVEPISLQLLEIKGVERNSEQGARSIEKILPKDYEFKLAYNPCFSEICSVDRNSKQYLANNPQAVNGIGVKFLQEILVPLKLMYNIEVQVFYNPKVENDEEDLFNTNNADGNSLHPGHHYKTSSLTSVGGRNLFQSIKNQSPLSPNFEFSSLASHGNSREIPQFHSIILSYFEQEVDRKDLERCLDLITVFLRDHKIIIIDKGFNDSKDYIVAGTSGSPQSTDGTGGSPTLAELNKENISSQEVYRSAQFRTPQFAVPQPGPQSSYHFANHPQTQTTHFNTNDKLYPQHQQQNQTWGHFNS